MRQFESCSLNRWKRKSFKRYKLFKENPGSYLLISGVNKSTKNIDVIPKDLLENKKVFIDRKSETTVDNAEEIIKWSYENNIDYINIITSDYHMPRSMLILRKKSKNLTFFADPVISSINITGNIFNNLKLLIFLSEEYLKYLLCYLVL